MSREVLLTGELADSFGWRVIWFLKNRSQTLQAAPIICPNRGKIGWEWRDRTAQFTCWRRSISLRARLSPDSDQSRRVEMPQFF